MAVIDITEENYEEFIKQGFAFIDFSASWCGPCRALAPVFEQVGKELEGKCAVGKADVDGVESICRTLGIMSVPTMVLFKDGEVVRKITGFRPKEYILEEVGSFLEE